MKKFPKLILGAVLATSLCFPAFGNATTTTTVDAATTQNYFSTTPTGYDSADDVVYVKSGNYIYNWGAREEDCTFLTYNAQSFNSGNYSFETLSQKAGGTSKDNAPTSDLYKALQSFMKSKHTYTNSYKKNNDLLQYTDCVSSNKSYISSFYSGTSLISDWENRNNTWNKEHTWPNSKGLSGSDEDDVMMIRPTSTSENSGRGNTAYGESSSYFNPTKHGADVRGDCARIFLYTYTRWGNTGSYAWGTSGVMENLTILLKWMKEDPVDTWEMGRNDAVQAITGTRNVFVDFPEYAWLLFGQKIPTDMVTPSGYAKSGTITGGSTGGNTGSGSGTTTPDDNTGSGSTATTNYTSISTLHSSAKGTSATAKGIVIAVANTGFMFNDGTGSMYFFTNGTKPNLKIGDKIEVSGVTSEFGGAIQFSSKDGATYTKKDVSVPKYTLPTPTVWDSDDVENYNGTVGQYVKITVKLAQSGTYFNAEKLSSTSQKIFSIVSPTDEVLGNIVLSSTAKEVVIRGYTCYLSGSSTKYAYVIPTSIKVPSEDVEEVFPDNGNENEGGNTDTPELPDNLPPADVIVEVVGMNCSGSVTGSLTVLSVAIGAVALLLKKKED